MVKIRWHIDKLVPLTYCFFKGVPFVIKHSQTGLCFYPKDGIGLDNVEVVLARKCDDRNSFFTWTKQRTLASVALKGFCFHPFGGSPNPHYGTKLVIYKLCRGRQLKFIYNAITMGLKQKTSGKFLKPATKNVVEGTGVVFGDANVKPWMRFKLVGKLMKISFVTKENSMQDCSIHHINGWRLTISRLPGEMT